MMIDRRLIPPTLITIYKGTIASKPFFIYSYKTANLREIATIISNNIFPLVSKFTFQLSQKQYSIYASKYSSDDDVRLVETGYVPGDFILIFDESEATPIRKFIGSGANFVPLGKHERVESDFPEKIYDRTQEKSRPSSVEKDSTVKKKKINSEGWGLPFVEPFVEKISEKVEKPKAENAWKPPIEEW